MITNGATPNYAWKWFMLALSAIYLVPELIFNTVLVDAVGTAGAASIDIHPIELFGRALSGIGVTLLLADILIRQGKLLGNFCKLLLIGLIVWPTVFFGQKFLVDYFLVNPSTPEERQQAFASRWLSSALASRTVDIEGIPLNPDSEQSPTEKSFLALFGGLVYVDTLFVESVRGQQAEIIERHIRKETYGEFDQRYVDYVALREKIQNQYSEYKKQKSKYYTEVNSIPAQADQSVKDLREDLTEGWGTYQNGRTQARNEIQKIATKAAPEIYYRLEREYGDKCHNRTPNIQERCKEANRSVYNERIVTLGFGHIPMEYWLIEKEVSTADNVARTAFNAVATAGLSLFFQGANKLAGGNGGWNDKEYTRTAEPGHYTKRLMQNPKVVEKLTSKLKGYPPDIDNYKQFLSHPVTAEKVRRRLQSKGIKLSSNWSPTDENDFRKAVSQKVRAEIDSRWNAEAAKRQLNLPPTLSWKSFQRHEEIQSAIREEMGEHYVSPVLATWNNKQFSDNVIEPNIRRKVQEAEEFITASLADFKDGGKHAEIGKDSLRSVLIPPISMGLSLFLVIITALKIPRNALRLARQQLTPANVPSYLKKSPFRFSAALSIVIFCGVISAPLVLANNEFTVEGSAVHYFVGSIKERASAGASGALIWVLNIQPLVQPLGERLEAELLVFQAFKELVSEEAIK